MTEITTTRHLELISRSTFTFQPHCSKRIVLEAGEDAEKRFAEMAPSYAGYRTVEEDSVEIDGRRFVAADPRVSGVTYHSGEIIARTDLESKDFFRRLALDSCEGQYMIRFENHTSVVLKPEDTVLQDGVAIFPDAERYPFDTSKCAAVA